MVYQVQGQQMFQAIQEQPDSGKSNSEKNNKTVNYEVNRITNDIISTPYVVKDLSINVGIEPPVKDDPNSLTAETKAAVQSALVNIVRTALADNKVTYTDEDLQKKVTVFAHSFARPCGHARFENNNLLDLCRFSFSGACNWINCRVRN